jgi:uncharacterized protein YbcI
MTKRPRRSVPAPLERSYLAAATTGCFAAIMNSPGRLAVYHQHELVAQQRMDGRQAGMSHFEQDYMSRRPKNIHVHLIGDLLVVRLQGILTAAERQLVKTLPAEKGRDLLKEVRTQLIETARPVLEALVEEATGVKVLSLHHDISTVTGEKFVLFTLAQAPSFRETEES